MAKADINARLGLDSSGFERGMQRSKKSLSRFGKGVVGVANKLTKIGLTSAAAGFVMLSRSAIKLGSELSDIAISTGFATEEFQVFRGALLDAGGEAKSMEKAITIMQKAVVQGDEGLTTYVRAFERLGLSVGDLRAMNPEQQFKTIGLAIAGAKDQQGALTAAIEIFGQRNAPRLIEVFKRLDKDGYGKMAKDIEKSYGIMDAATQAALDSASDKIERFKNKATIFVGELISMEGDGAAFKVLGLQFGKAASNFGLDLFDSILQASKKGALAIAASLKAAFSRATFEEVFAASLQQFPVEQNKLLKALADSNDKYYDKQIAAQKAKVQKARDDFAKQKKMQDIARVKLEGAIGGGGSGGGSGGGKYSSAATKLGELTGDDLRRAANADAKSRGKDMRFERMAGGTYRGIKNGKIVGNLTEEQLQSGLRGGARAQKSEKDKELERQTNILKSIEKELKGT